MLASAKGILVALCLGECSPSACFLCKSVLEALYLGKVELHGHCGGLAATVFCRCVRQCVHLGGCRLSALFPNCRLGLLVPLVSLIGDGLCLHGSRLSTLLHCLQRTRAAFLLGRREVWQASREKRRRRRSHRKMTWAVAICRA